MSKFLVVGQFEKRLHVFSSLSPFFRGRGQGEGVVQPARCRRFVRAAPLTQPSPPAKSGGRGLSRRKRQREFKLTHYRESRSDLARGRAKTEAELEADIMSDPDFRDIPEDWHATAQAVMPVPKKLLSLRIDNDMVDWFKQQGPGYQTRINAALRAFVDQQIGKGHA